MRYKGLRRRKVKRKPGTKPTEYLTPEKKKRGNPYSQSKDYQYFSGHVVPDIIRSLPDKKVVCWYNDHILSLRSCSLNKHWLEKSYCKRCPLFQKDEHAQELRSLIEKWEEDDLTVEE